MRTMRRPPGARLVLRAIAAVFRALTWLVTRGGDQACRRYAGRLGPHRVRLDAPVLPPVGDDPLEPSPEGDGASSALGEAPEPETTPADRDRTPDG